MKRAALAAFVALVVLTAPSSVVGEDRIVQGKASTYGDGYEGLFALPSNLGGRGEHVRICSVVTHRCLERTSNDVGPVLRLHRVADLDATDFEYLCKCRWETVGVIEVRITFLSKGHTPTAPPTDLETQDVQGNANLGPIRVGPSATQLGSTMSVLAALYQLWSSGWLPLCHQPWLR